MPTYNARSNYSGDTSTTQWGVTFPFLLRDHIKVYLDEVETTAFTWVHDGLIDITPALATGVALSIRRETPVGTLVVDYVDGANLVEVDLDNAQLQVHYIVEELIDRYQILITGVDLDADTLDSLDSTDFALAVHAHVIADVTGLQTALDGKALAAHIHDIADITGLQAALDAKAASVHTHVIADTTGLQAALDGKAASAHTHVKADITDFTHTHLEADITDLQAYLTDAPSNGSEYVRKNAAWAVATGGGGGGDVAVEDEGVEILAAATRLNFAGAGVTVTDAGASKALITIPGGGGGGTPGTTELAVHDFTATAQLSLEADVTGIDAVMISAIGCPSLEVQVSTDGGATWDNTSGDYNRTFHYHLTPVQDATQTGFQLTDSAGSTTGVHAFAELRNLSTADIETHFNATGARSSAAAAGEIIAFRTTKQVENRIRVVNSAGGNITAGVVRFTYVANGAAISGLLGSETFSAASATTGIDISGIAATSGLRVELMNGSIAGGPHVIAMEVSTDSGSTWKTAVTDYSYGAKRIAGGVYADTEDLTAAAMYLAIPTASTANNLGTTSAMRSTVKMGNPADGEFMGLCHSGFKSSSGSTNMHELVFWYTGTGTVNTIRLVAGGGTMSGRWSVFEEKMA